MIATHRNAMPTNHRPRLSMARLPYPDTPLAPFQLLPTKCPGARIRPAPCHRSTRWPHRVGTASAPLALARPSGDREERDGAAAEAVLREPAVPAGQVLLLDQHPGQGRGHLRVVGGL